jgi:hypothetical protein
MDDVRSIQDRFDQAELTGDRDTLRELIADGFQSIGPRGFVLDKDQWIDRHDQFVYHVLDTSETDVQVHGDDDDIAIVRNVQRNRATYRGQDIAASTRVTQVWIRQDGRWQLAAIQFSPLADG